MAERFLVSVDLKNLNNGIDLKTISYLERLHITVLPESIENALLFLQSYSGLLNIYCDCYAISDPKQIVSVLDAGSVKVFLNQSTLRGVLDRNLVTHSDFKRLALCLGRSTEDRVEEQVEEAISATRSISQEAKASLGLCGSPEDSSQLLACTREKKLASQVYIQCMADSDQRFTALVKQGCVVVIPAQSLTTDPAGKEFPVHRLFTDLLHSDRPDGLFPTVVTDERGTCLGLVYSNQESIGKALQTGCGVYYSRSRKGLWIKGEESGNTQELVSISLDCDADSLQFKVRQKGEGSLNPVSLKKKYEGPLRFCHLQSLSCFGASSGISRLEHTLQSRRQSAPIGSYTAKLFNDPKLLQAKILEEASELGEATEKSDIAAEAADLLYFALAKCTAADVSFKDVEDNLDQKSLKITRRKGDAKPRWAEKVGLTSISNEPNGTTDGHRNTGIVKEASSVPKAQEDPAGLIKGKIKMQRYRTAETIPETIKEALQRPSQRSTEEIMNIVKPIINDIRKDGDTALLKYTSRFEKATSLASPIIQAPFPQSLMQIPQETIEAIDTSYNNIRRFHSAQQETKPLQVETMPGVTCTRFSRPIERVGLYVPGGTAVLPSTALMLGVPAMVAGCKTIVLATPPRSDGTITPEIVYVAHKIGAESIVLAGGAQAVAALAYGTESVSKVDKILGPGNQFVTAGKMIVSNDTTAGVSIDMPAGPSEVLVIADKTANPAFVAADLLSQAEHGTDSQVILIAVDLSEKELSAIEDELHSQANALPRVDIVRGAIDHSVTLVVRDIEEAMQYSNQYAPEHLILQVANAEDVVRAVENAGSVFVGPWTPESVGDYSAGVNHSLPTYGYAKQYSGVNLSSFTKHITSSNLSREGLRNVGEAVMQLAKVEELEAHRRAVSIRLKSIK